MEYSGVLLSRSGAPVILEMKKGSRRGPIPPCSGQKGAGAGGLGVTFIEGITLKLCAGFILRLLNTLVSGLSLLLSVAEMGVGYCACIPPPFARPGTVCSHQGGLAALTGGGGSIRFIFVHTCLVLHWLSRVHSSDHSLCLFDFV